jgi:coproporphyrinogen III oxidase-like Fe-S oxidoreductase
VFEGKDGMGWKIARCPATDSAIMAMASGESQMQQYTFSKVLMDEFPRWKNQEECWRNIQPTTQGGGCVDMVCTAELGVFAYDLLYDEVT